MNKMSYLQSKIMQDILTRSNSYENIKYQTCKVKFKKNLIKYDENFAGELWNQKM